MFDISALVASAWTIFQPLLPTIAAKGAEEFGKRTVSEAWDLIKKKFEEKPETSKLLSKLLEKPENTDTQGAFKYQMKDFLEADLNLATKLATLLRSEKNDLNGTVIGEGALAQGAGAKAVGANGILIEGRINGDVNLNEPRT